MHLHPGARIAALAVAASIAALVTGCSAQTTVLTAAEVIKDVASQARHDTSVTGTMDMESTGPTAFSMQGTLKVRTVPSLGIELDLTKMSTGGQTLPGGIREILTSKALYMKVPGLGAQTGKPWIKISMGQLNSRTNNAFANLGQQIKQQDPLSAAQMLGASKDVKAEGKATVGGVPTTHYHGTFSYQEAISMLPPNMRKLERKFAATLTPGKIVFDAWVDAQNHPRKIVESYDMTSLGHITITVRFTSFNQPVSIKAPPASEVSSIPGLGLR
jgi:hypothetical protein